MTDSAAVQDPVPQARSAEVCAPSWGRRALVVAPLGVALLAGRGLSSQPVPALAWAALAAVPLGTLVGARGLPALLLAPAVWLLADLPLGPVPA